MIVERLLLQPGHLIRRSHQLAWAAFMEMSGERDLTPLQYAALVGASAYPGIDATRLSDLMAIDRATVGNVVQRLERRGLLARSRDGADKRAKLIFITKRGSAVVEAVSAHESAIEARMFEKLSAGEIDRLKHILAKMVGIDDHKRRASELDAERERTPKPSGIARQTRPTGARP